ncbi:hypothetical protein [Pseudomonas phage PIP]|nr:hypothetical protein [Pseudomonas phage PIP]
MVPVICTADVTILRPPPISSNDLGKSYLIWFRRDQLWMPRPNSSPAGGEPDVHRATV